MNDTTEERGKRGEHDSKSSRVESGSLQRALKGQTVAEPLNSNNINKKSLWLWFLSSDDD